MTQCFDFGFKDDSDSESESESKIRFCSLVDYMMDSSDLVDISDSSATENNSDDDAREDVHITDDDAEDRQDEGGHASASVNSDAL